MTYVLREPEEEDPLSPTFGRKARIDVLLVGGVDRYREVFREDPTEDIVSEAAQLRLRFPRLPRDTTRRTPERVR